MGNTICPKVRRERNCCNEHVCTSGSSSRSSSSSDTSSVGSNVPCQIATNTDTGTAALRKHLQLVEANDEEFIRRYPTIWNVCLPPDMQCKMTLQDAIAILSGTGLVLVTEIKFMPLVHEMIARIYNQMPHTVAPHCDRTTYGQLQTLLNETVGKCTYIINELRRRGVPLEEDCDEIRRKTARIQSPEEVQAAAVLSKASIAAFIGDVNQGQFITPPLSC